MVSATGPRETRLQELRLAREPLSKQFDKNPNDTRLALQLKSIDDKISECTREIQGDRRKQK